jgi:AraC-like DNA-binding protein
MMGSITQEVVTTQAEPMHQGISTRSSTAGAFSSTVKGESLLYDEVLDLLQSQVSFTEAVLVTSMPRGGLQIAQPQQIAVPLLKNYTREFHLEDRATWLAIQRDSAVRGEECWSEYKSARFVREFLQAHGLYYVAAAPVEAPVMEGYAGALNLYRTHEQGEFTEQDLRKLEELSRQLQETIHSTRLQRKVRPCLPEGILHRPRRVRQFILDKNLRPQLEAGEFENLEPRVRAQILQHARRALEHTDTEAVSDRVPLPDSNGDMWIFRVVLHREYPALGEGPFIFFCLQPECRDWSALRSSDLQADNELARLVPAVRFMEQEFHRSPTLGEIAKTVHLSPFHFHRRFSELLGITPKHFLLNCQIEEAKRQLLAREKDLAQIATDCGFAHQSHFTSRFKQATGLTPTRWRRYASDRQQQAGSDN